MSTLPEPVATRWSEDDYADAFAHMLPQGPAWPRDPDTVLMRFTEGLAALWPGVNGRGADLLERESDPRATIEMLDSWEAAFGLPDPCVSEPLTIADRQKALVQRMTMQGGQSIPFFISLAAAIGYAITISERSPFMCGVSRCGDTSNGDGKYRWEIGPPEIRFQWTVHVGATRLTWFRVGSGQVGVDPHLRIALATDLECLIRKYAPGHTVVLFDYSGLEAGGSMAGTP